MQIKQPYYFVYIVNHIMHYLLYFFVIKLIYMRVKISRCDPWNGVNKKLPINACKTTPLKDVTAFWGISKN